MNIKEIINNFWEYKNTNNIEIYNEFSFQHELGIYLRNKLSNYKIQFERNITFFYSDAKNTIKHEIDIVIYKQDLSEMYAIELKYPRNGKYPEEMFSFIKDIKFMEEVKELGFNKTFTMTFVEDSKFYQGKIAADIYSFFRGNKTIHGQITKPTGKKDRCINLNGQYKIEWQQLEGKRKYYILEL